jgi:hypothetical protein
LGADDPPLHAMNASAVSETVNFVAEEMVLCIIRGRSDWRGRVMRVVCSWCWELYCGAAQTWRSRWSRSLSVMVRRVGGMQPVSWLLVRLRRFGGRLARTSEGRRLSKGGVRMRVTVESVLYVGQRLTETRVLERGVVLAGVGFERVG